MDVDHVTSPSYSSPPHEDIPNNRVQQQQAISLVHVDPASTPSSGSDQEASHPRISVSLHVTTQDHLSGFVFTHGMDLGTPQPHNTLSSDKSSEYESEDEFSSEDHECEEQEGEKEHSEDDDSLDEPLILQAGRIAPQNCSQIPAPSLPLKSPVLNILRHSPAFGHSRIPRKPVGVGYSPQHALNRLEVENAYLISQNTSLNRDIQHCRNTVMALKQIVAQKEEIIEQMRHEHRQACLKAKFMESVLAEYHDARDGSEPGSTMHEAYPRIQHKINPAAKFGQGADDDDDLSYSDMDNSELESDEEDYDNQNDGDHESEYDGSVGGQHPSNLIHGDDLFVQISLDDNPHHTSTSDTEAEPIVDSPQLRRRPRQSLSSVIPFGSSTRLQSTFSGFALAIPGPPASNAPESDLGDTHTGLRDGQFSIDVFNIGTEGTSEETASESTLTPTTIKETDLDLDLDVPQEKNNGDTFDPTTKNIPAPQPNNIGHNTKTATSDSNYLACVNIEATGSSGSLVEHSPSSEGGSTLPATSPDQDSKDHLSATSTMTTLPTDDDSIELCPSKRDEPNTPDPETVSIASSLRPTSPSTILARLWQGVGRQTASLFGRQSASKSKHSSHNKGLSSQPASGVRVTRIGIRRIGSRSRFRSLTTSPVSVTVSGGVAMTSMQVDPLKARTQVN
ncbi:hypothetical protein BG006_008838 [Podila minutissima]|uniref:Uncharacterized protein n=1 Tax=Podila minutissima TaxID=64525 RepID=A0A9P5VJV9_9FUNG|nr:hypothetical protein BG006_008838 [Podila minutissima]